MSESCTRTKYIYDGNGQRVQKCMPNCTSPTSSTVYAFSGSQDLAEYDKGAAPSSPSREFIYSDSVPGSGLLASVVAGTTTYFHSDHLSWRISTGTTGQIVGQQGTFPFGESWYSSSGNEFVFTSYQRDAESGLDYAMARYYDSTVGRFCSADPVGGQVDDPQTWDRYVYARNDPIDLTDPSGQAWWNWLVDILAGIGSVVLPEIAPAVFGQTITTDATVQIGAVATTTTFEGSVIATSTAPVWGSITISQTIGGGLVGAMGGAVQNTGPPNAQPPSPQPNVKPKDPACNSQPATNFVKAHQSDAATLAKQMKVPTNFVLAMAGDESQYGTSNIALGANNYFGLWAGAPGSTGPWSGNPIVSAFPGGNGFLTSGQSFVQVAKPLLSGITNPSNGTAFFTAMHAKFGVGHSLQGYLNKMTGPKGVANMTARRMNCP